MRRWLVAILAVVTLASCSGTNFPVEGAPARAKTLGAAVTVVPLNAQLVAALDSRPPAPPPVARLPEVGHWSYRVGAGDVLDVVVWDHPELTLPAGAQRSAADSGQVVQPDGTFFYPYVGKIRAAGRTPEQIRQDLAVKLAKYIPDPQMVVRVAAYNSQFVSITGEVAKPARMALDNQPLTLLQAIDAAGGMSKTADPRHVVIRRLGHVYTVDLKAFLDSGVGRNNPILISGDVVNVPKLKTREAFLLGQVKKPAPVDLSQDPVSLTQALTTVGGLNEQNANARGVFVFRRNGARGVIVYQLDVRSPIAYVLGAKFMLEPNDVVYVTRTPVARWNDTISNVLPTVSAIYQINHLGTIF